MPPNEAQITFELVFLSIKAFLSHRLHFFAMPAGAVSDPYPGKRRLGFTWWATPSGWSRAKAALNDWAQTVFAVGICRLDVPGFKIGEPVFVVLPCCHVLVLGARGMKGRQYAIPSAVSHCAIQIVPFVRCVTQAR